MYLYVLLDLFVVSPQKFVFLFLPRDFSDWRSHQPYGIYIDVYHFALAGSRIRYGYYQSSTSVLPYTSSSAPAFPTTPDMWSLEKFVSYRVFGRDDTCSKTNVAQAKGKSRILGFCSLSFKCLYHDVEFTTKQKKKPSEAIAGSKRGKMADVWFRHK